MFESGFGHDFSLVFRFIASNFNFHFCYTIQYGSCCQMNCKNVYIQVQLLSCVWNRTYVEFTIYSRTSVARKAWGNENKFQSKVAPASQGKYLYL